jgi:hypothetical protein
MSIFGGRLTGPARGCSPPRMPISEADTKYAGQEFAILDGTTVDIQTSAPATLLVAELRAIVEGAGIPTNEIPDRVRRPQGFRFSIEDDRLEVRFLPTDGQFQVIRSEQDNESEEAASKSKAFRVPLVFDPHSGTFVGEELEQDIGLAPGEYRPRKTAMKVLVETIKAAVED